MSRWVGGWVTGVGECGVEELLVAASFIVRSLCWLNAFQMEFAFWDCGGLQALVAVQSGEFQIVHGIGAAEGFRGGPWEFRDGLLHGSAATVDPKHQFDWDVALGDDMALSLEHRHSEVSIPCSVAQNMFEGKVLNLSLPHGAGSSSSGTALSLFETEVHWSTAPTAFADGEPISLWVPLTHVVAFLYPACSDLKRKCGNTYEAWKRMMQTCGLATDHLQRSKRSADARAKDADGFEPFSLDEGAAMDWRTTAPGFTLLLTCLSVSGRYHDDDGGPDRACALLRGWVDYVLRPDVECYVIGGPDAAVPVVNGEVVLDVLLADQEAEGVPPRSRTLLSMNRCL